MNDLVEGSVWEIFFYTKEKVNFGEKFTESFLNDHTRELTNTFDPPPGLTPQDYSALFLQHFTKSREASRAELEKISVQKHRYRTLVQVGNRECIEDLEKTMNSPDFHSWENPYTVEVFLEISKKYLNE